jgi:uncharacterized damage-inducible protein DinB/predicted RNase H-like HicB family nuclease
MMLYKLYLESGPMHKKTMVHVLDLPGCIANGPTTEIALEKTPHAIQAYLDLLQRHGEMADPDREIQIEIVEHITEGMWLGNGDPTLLFPPDMEPLTREDLEVFIKRLEWSRMEIIELVRGLSAIQIAEKPPVGRSVQAILGHIFGAEYAAVRMFGKLDEIAGPDMNKERSTEELLGWMEVVRASEIKKLRSLSNQKLAEPVKRSTYTRTTRAILRRILEHEWEHLTELRERPGH